MSQLPAEATPSSTAFTEKDFYLREFRGRHLAIAVPAADLRAPAPLRRVLSELTGNGTRVVLISTERSAVEPLSQGHVLSSATPRLEAVVWRSLRESSVLGLVVGGSLAFAPACRDVALHLRCSKLVWIDRDGGLLRAPGDRLSFVHLNELRALLASGGTPLSQRRLALLREVELMLDLGLPAVNVCTLEGLAEELFTYGGSGTLFTRERYVIVRPLGLDDFDAANDLIARGVDEGYLAPRTPEEVEEVLASGFGAFVEDRHLAGIGALLIEPLARAGEIASLYTLTRFLGEGVGTHLVAFAVELGRRQKLDYVFACTTSPRVSAFFERNAFRPVVPDDLPPSKWRGYDAERRARVSCYRRDLE
jgi:amino-acid N-acetyltransferase